MLRIRQELVRRVSSEPGIRGVVLASSLPGEEHLTAPIQVEGRETVPRVRLARVEVDFFRELASQVLTGRDFHSSDVESLPLEKRVAVIVNTSFVDNVLEGSSPLGHQNPGSAATALGGRSGSLSWKRGGRSTLKGGPPADNRISATRDPES